MVGFKLMRFSAIKPVMIEDIPVEDRPPALEIAKGELPEIKTLGVTWEAEKDVFAFQI